MNSLRKFLLGALIWLAILWPASESCLAQKPPKLSKAKIAKLTEDGDRLVDQADYQAALEKYTQAYLGVVSRIRGQQFSHSVQPSIFNRQQLSEEMLKMMQDEYSEEDLLLMDGSYKVFGLVPAELDSGKLMTQLLTEEVAGFYDPDNKRMVLIVEDGPHDKPSWLGRLLGAKPAFDRDEQKTTLAHELTHALQDQLYDLNAMEAGIKDDDDMLLAFSALVEGDATLLMFAEAGDIEDISTIDPDAMRATFNLVSWMMPLAGGNTYRAAPAIFRDSLTFPYFQGMLFALALASKDGWDEIHRAFENPPLSTEQILHPRKYSDEIDNPQRVRLPDLSQDVSEKWNQLGGNCLGELQTSILLKRVAGGKQAALGWDGDRYQVFRSPTAALGLVYVSVWDSETDAVEFANAYREYRKSNAEKSQEAQEPNNEPAAEAAARHATSVFSPDAVQVVRQQGDKVWIVEGFEREITDRILAKLPQTTFEEKRFPSPR